jgi:hypothetical protein
MTATAVCVGYDSGIVACFDVDGNTLFDKKLAQFLSRYTCTYIYAYTFIDVFINVNFRLVPLEYYEAI